MPTPLQIQSARINGQYLRMMNTAPQDSVLARVRDIWWEPYIQTYQDSGATSLDSLDLCMDRSRARLNEMAQAYARQKVPAGTGSRFTLYVNQFLKSNTGKMFERFVGLCIAHHLKTSNSDYCIWPFRDDMRSPPRQSIHRARRHGNPMTWRPDTMATR